MMGFIEPIYLHFINRINVEPYKPYLSYNVSDRDLTLEIFALYSAEWIVKHMTLYISKNNLELYPEETYKQCKEDLDYFFREEFNPIYPLGDFRKSK